MRVIERNILAVDHGIIAHQVNCRRRINAGLAKGIVSKWPEAKARYLQECDKESTPEALLGRCAIGSVSTDKNKFLMVAHLFGQLNFGKYKRQTDYFALSQALQTLEILSLAHDLPVYLPYMVGCGLGGGSWLKVRTLIKVHCPLALICRLPD